MGILSKFYKEVEGKIVVPDEKSDEGKRIIEVSEEDFDMIFKGYRPRKLDSEDFKFISKLLKRTVKEYLKGQVVHLSKVNNTVWLEYTKGKKIRQRGHTYIKANEEK